jgi:hypothetical protein
MGYNSDTQKITAPVDMGDISAAIGVDCLNIVVLANSENAINQWSFRKPVDFNSPGEITDEDVVSVNCGLRPVAVSKLLTQSIGSTTSSSTSYSKDECLAEVRQWQYIKPSVWCRMTDFDGYNHLAVAPDGGWAHKDISADTLAEMKGVAMAVTAGNDLFGDGKATAYNFKLTPQLNGVEYNKALYQTFAIRFGEASGEQIGNTYQMDIPLNYIASLDGYWRIALAVWCPNFGSHGGWGFFASRMTIAQYIASGAGSGDSLRNLMPDLASNPYVASIMQSYMIAQGGYAEFTAVPLLVRNLGNTRINGQFCLMAVSGTTSAYCMPSGADAIPLVCGEAQPEFIAHYYAYTKVTDGVIGAYIQNTDTEANHTFGFKVTTVIGGVPGEREGTQLVNAGRTVQVGGVPSQAGNAIYITVISQDGVEVPS